MSVLIESINSYNVEQHITEVGGKGDNIEEDVADG